jgi:hypothetical protein
MCLEKNSQAKAWLFFIQLNYLAADASAATGADASTAGADASAATGADASAATGADASTAGADASAADAAGAADSWL